MPFKLALTQRRMIYERDGGICAYCRTFVPWDQFDVDHIIPRAYGGKHEAGNLRTSHRSCNRRAGQRMRQPGASSLPYAERGRW
jgi:5-methylcytosine-specific restriction endonuclease McrA